MTTNNKTKEAVQKILSYAGVKINGKSPWDIQVLNEDFYDKVLRQGSIGLGEAYMDNYWEAEKLDEFFERVMRAKLESKIVSNWKTLLFIASHIIFNQQRKSKNYEVAERHYDIGNDLYRAMLDDRMVYSCGYWNPPAGGVNNLNEAQEAKLDLICRKIGIKPGQKVLDIGCGWGSFAKYAAEKYGAIVTGITISKEQANLASETCKGLPVEILLQDYRDIQGKFDHIVSIGMFEHVGYKNYKNFMQIVQEHLNDNGLFLLHTIGTNVSSKTTDPWLMKYIFPNGLLPSIKQISKSAENIFVMEDLHNFGIDYEKTVLAWFDNFNAAWPKLKDKYGQRFYRMWKYYLLGAAASFRTRSNHLWQIVYSKNGISGGYKEIR